MSKQQEKNIIQAIKWLTKRVAELQCYHFPAPQGEDPNKYVEDNKRDKLKRINKILTK